MGRRPNPVITNYFNRGPKLSDNSNRYPHTCKLCGSIFPKGRIDSLTNHITKPGRCPAIHETDRIQACLALHNIPSPNHGHRRLDLKLSRNGGLAGAAPIGSPNWTALEALAEASRQVDMNEKQDGVLGNDGQIAPESHFSGEQYGFDSTPPSYDAHDHIHDHEATSLDNSLAAPTNPEHDVDPANLSVVAAAAARLGAHFLDPQLVEDEVAVSMALPMPTQVVEPGMHPSTSNPPWGEITYIGATPPLPAHGPTEAFQAPVPQHRGGVRMDTLGENGSPGRHRRAKFNAVRRKEVQEVRKIGACIRCRILRKNCGKGNPCETCRKVLSPRVWKTGCIRTRLHEQLDLYSAGVQVVLAQRRYNFLKDSLRISSRGTVVEGSQFPDSGFSFTAPVFRISTMPGSLNALQEDGGHSGYQAVMLDHETDDISALIDTYMHQVLPFLRENEPSRFVRTMLQTATQVINDSDDALLQGAMELWGLVDIIDRERQWKLVEKHLTDVQFTPQPISETTEPMDLNVYTIICLQLNAAAERKANTVSRTLLNGMQRLLQDSKVKIGFPMFLTALLFLHCVEKSTWGFRAWDQEALRGGWPLERSPSTYTEQGENIANILQVLLSVRKVLPLKAKNRLGKLVLAPPFDDAFDAFYKAIDLDYDAVEAIKEFDPGNSRSLELSFCSQLLLPKE